MNHQVDVVVIGGGSAGEVAAGRLAKAGLSVALIESYLVGGECSYWACMPAKALLRPGQVLAEARQVPGASDAVTGSVNIDAVLHRRDEMASFWEDSAQARWLNNHDVELVRGAGRLAGHRRVVVGDDVLTARRAVIVATGSRPAVPPIDGIDEVRLWDNRDITSAQGVPGRMLIIGGGAVGVESAQAWRRLGSAEVSIFESGDRLLPGEEPFAGEELAAKLRAEGIDVFPETEIVKLTRNDFTSATATSADGTELDTDVVVAATGRRPSTENLGLESIGLEPGAPILVDESMRSRVHPDWLFAIGDVNGDDLFTHMGKYEARIAADAISGRGDSHAAIGRRAVPRIVFTDPMVAAVGHTEASADSAGINTDVREAPISEQAEASIWGDGVTGTAKLVIDTDTSTLVGATFTGPAPLAELTYGAQVAIVAETPVSVMRHVVPQFPTFSEVWLDLLEA